MIQASLLPGLSVRRLRAYLLIDPDDLAFDLLQSRFDRVSCVVLEESNILSDAPKNRPQLRGDARVKLIQHFTVLYDCRAAVGLTGLS